MLIANAPIRACGQCVPAIVAAIDKALFADANLAIAVRQHRAVAISGGGAAVGVASDALAAARREHAIACGVKVRLLEAAADGDSLCCELCWCYCCFPLE